MSQLHPRDIVCLVLCAGKGTRLRPLTLTRPKQLLPLCNVPVIDHILSAIREAGILNVGMVWGPDSQSLRDYVANGHRWGLEIEWILQEEPKGIGHAVLVSERYVNGRPFVVYLGDAIYPGGIRGFVDRFAQVFPASLLRLAPVEDPTPYGVAVVEDGIVVDLEEKPDQPQSNLAITGLYAFPSEFFETIGNTAPSGRGELELTDAMASLLAGPAGVQPEIWEQDWVDAGQPQSFLEANRLMLGWAGEMPNAAAVHDSELSGNVGAGEGTVIRESRVEGPVLIGRGCRVTRSHIGPHVSLGDSSVIENSRVHDAVIDTDSAVRNVQGGLGASIVGRRSRIISAGGRSRLLGQVVEDDGEVRID